MSRPVHDFDLMCKEHEVYHELNGCRVCGVPAGEPSPHGSKWCHCDTPAEHYFEKIRRFQELHKAKG